MNFRKLAALALVLFALTLKGLATDVVFQLTDARLNASGQATNRTLWVQRMSYPDSVNSQQVILGDKIIFTTDTNGACTFSNSAAGLYQCSVQAPPTRTQFSILVMATNLGTIYAGDSLVAASTSTFPAGSVAWSASVTDSRYARASSSLSNYVTGATLTNALNTKQVGSSNLTNWSAFNTNFFLSTNIFSSSSNALYVFSQTIGTGATNYIVAQGTSITNFTLAQGTAITNFIKAQDTNLTNTIAALGANVTNSLNNKLNTTDGIATNSFRVKGSLTVDTNLLVTGTSFSGASHTTNTSSAATFNATTVRATNLFIGEYFTGTNSYVLVSGQDTYGIEESAITAEQLSYLQDVTGNIGAAITNLGYVITNVFYPRSNPSNYVTASVTNGLPSTNYVQSLTNAQWILLGTAARSNATVFYPMTGNPSNWVTQTITNVLSARLGTAAFQNSNFFYTANNPSGFITTAATNGFASQTYVLNQTNSLWALLGTAARSNASAFYLNSNPSNFVTQTVTNALSALLGSAAFSNAVVFYPSNNPLSFITLAPVTSQSNTFRPLILANQIGSANLTNWSAHPTNDYLATNQFYINRAKDVGSNTIVSGHGLFWDSSTQKYTNGAHQAALTPDCLTVHSLAQVEV
jgi:hypothetical protein